MFTGTFRSVAPRDGSARGQCTASGRHRERALHLGVDLGRWTVGGLSRGGAAVSLEKRRTKTRCTGGPQRDRALGGQTRHRAKLPTLPPGDMPDFLSAADER
jgi:hypothetical protein